MAWRLTTDDVFTTGLAAALSGDPARERVLLAPSYRVGRQWLDRVSLTTGGTANVRVVTLKRLLLDHADEELRERGLHPAGDEEAIPLAGRVLADLSGERADAGYFTRLPASLELAATLRNAFEELDHAEAGTARVFAGGVRSREKADELRRLHADYRAAGSRAGLAAPADVAACALRGLARIGEPPILLAPRSLVDEATRLERRFLDAWPEEALRVIPEDDGPCRAAMEFRRSDTTADEAREVFRDILGRGIPLDACEVVCLDASQASALCSAALEVFGGTPEDAPLSFHSGLPVSLSRPARLFSAWIAWLELDMPPSGLAGILRSGLLGRRWRDDAPEIGAEALAARILALPIHGGPASYRGALGRDVGAGAVVKAEAWLVRVLPDIVPLANGGASLDLLSGPVVLGAFRNLLDLDASSDDRFDAYARLALRETLDAWLPHADWPGFRPLAWLESQLSGLRVMGLGPMPGRLFVSELSSGGHSGREHTFIPGLDDQRFPGTARQDPIFLDGERAKISRHLPLSRSRRQRRENAMRLLLARLRGRVVLSHAGLDVASGRSLFPSALFAGLAGAADSGVAGPGVLRPGKESERLCRRDDWLFTLLAERRNDLTPEALRRWHPGLAEGWFAGRERLSPRFTRYDGHVPEAGEDYRRGGEAVSPTDLETLAANPMEYFYKRVLGIAPPDRFEPSPGRWLEGNERGSLLHDLFQDFVKALMEEGERVDDGNWERWRTRLLEMLERALARQRRRKPVRDRLAYGRERGEMLEACVIFLNFERERGREGRPVCLEAALGGAREEAPPWNRTGPVELPLSSGRTLRLKGRVDRIERLDEHGGLMIWDYKTGRSDKFSRSDPFRQGRHMQPFLYAMMLDGVLRDAGLPEPVRGFSYFFPMPRDEGRVFSYAWRHLREGGEEIAVLLEAMLGSGIFPFSPALKDSEYSDYGAVWGAAAPLAAAFAKKMENDPALEPWARLRAIKPPEAGE